MSQRLENKDKEPLRFSNAPTSESDGVRYLDDSAATELGDRVAKRYADLLERLSRE